MGSKLKLYSQYAYQRTWDLLWLSYDSNLTVLKCHYIKLPVSGKETVTCETCIVGPASTKCMLTIEDCTFADILHIGQHL